MGMLALLELALRHMLTGSFFQYCKVGQRPGLYEQFAAGFEDTSAKAPRERHQGVCGFCQKHQCFVAGTAGSSRAVATECKPEFRNSLILAQWIWNSIPWVGIPTKDAEFQIH